ncbi:response regulator transcription factor [Methylovorus mays]|uniref:response regulator transcription factor n=1 Tax=Methylovorus mays TaxID=184077 RepID=UPI001E598589|nr:response regulator [Methylovorus mays]MCB5208066.1 response regulator [Methylovorus mays]
MELLNSHSKNVIIIDDDPAINASMSRFLTLAGYQCHVFGSAVGVISFIKEHTEFLTTPSCIVCDNQMSGMTGLQLQEALQDKDINVPLILISGESDVHEVASGFRKGAIDFLIKPLDVNKLEQATEKALAYHSTQLQSTSSKSILASRVALLTPREREVARLVAKGHTNLGVALNLNIALRTVKLHRHRALKKLNASGLVDLVKISELVDL